MIPAVIYARYSSSSQREESIEGQIRECRKYAERFGFEILKEYTDAAMTGTNDNRPGFQKMIRDSASHRFKAVIVWKMDRFARNRKVASDYKAELRKNGVNLYYAMESVPEGSSGIIFDGLLESMAEYYSANLSENIRRGQYDSALEHKTLGIRTLGYRKSDTDHYEIDPVTAPIVRRIFQEYADGRRYVDIVKDLNNDGIRTVRGQPFTLNSLRKILRNEKYIGTYKFKDLVNDEDAIPAIVDKDLFAKVQGMLQKAVSRPSEADKDEDGIFYVLTTKLFCGHCGEPMTGESARSKTGRIYRYYSCNGTKPRFRNGCTKKRVDKDLIEAAVLRIITEEILTDEFIESIIDGFMEDQEKEKAADTLNAYEAQLKEVDRKIENIMKAIEDGIYTATTKDRLVALETSRDELQRTIEAEKILPPKISREALQVYFRDLRDLSETDTSFQNILISRFVKKIYLFDDDEGSNHKISIELNITGKDKEPISREEVLDLVRADCPRLHSRTCKRTRLIISDGSVLIVATLSKKDPRR